MKLRKIKSILVVGIIYLMAYSIKAQAPIFSVASPNGNYTLSCANTPITMVATNTVPVGPYSYTWTISGSTLIGNYVNVSQAGTWTVTCQNTVTAASSQQTFSIFQNLQSPTVVVTPTVQNVICIAAANCFTGTSNLSPNVTTNWYQLIGANKVYVGVPQGTINILCPNNPGVYWFESVNNLTGCGSTKSVQVTASVGVPAFTVTSPSNFTIGCSTTSITSMQVSSVVTSPVPNVAVAYTFCPPPATTVITPTTVLSANPNQNNITIPGVWVVYVKDLTNNCLVSQSISIIQNTLGANLDFILPLSILSCSDPGMLMNGISSNSNTSITWTVPGIPSNSVIPIPNYSVSINSAIPGATVNVTSLGVFTVGAVDQNNLCRSTKTVQIIQDIRKPFFTVSASTNSVITCINTSVILNPVISASLAGALIPTFIWQAPLSPTLMAASMTATVGGSHTVTATSLINGCSYTSFYNVAADNMTGAFDATVGTACPASTMVVSPVYSGTFGLSFAWSGPAGAIVSPTNQSTVIGNALGVYTCVVTNSINGCSNTVTCSVVCNTGLLSNPVNTNSIRVFPNPSNGKLTIEAGINATAFVLFDLQGKQLLEKEIKGISSTLELSFAKGFYFYQIKDGDKVLKKDKLIIE